VSSVDRVGSRQQLLRRRRALSLSQLEGWLRAHGRIRSWADGGRKHSGIARESCAFANAS
jgi:hypothetical protein